MIPYIRVTTLGTGDCAGVMRFLAFDSGSWSGLRVESGAGILKDSIATHTEAQRTCTCKTSSQNDSAASTVLVADERPGRALFIFICSPQQGP